MILGMKVLGLVLIGLSILLPFCFVKKKHGFFRFYLLSTSISCCLLLLSVYIFHTTTEMDLRDLGVQLEFQGVDESGSFDLVSKDKISEAKKLHTSYMGIGWPVKFLFLLPLILIYPVVVYVAGRNYLVLSK